MLPLLNELAEQYCTQVFMCTSYGEHHHGFVIRKHNNDWWLLDSMNQAPVQVAALSRTRLPCHLVVLDGAVQKPWIPQQRERWCIPLAFNACMQHEYIKIRDILDHMQATESKLAMVAGKAGQDYIRHTLKERHYSELRGMHGNLTVAAMNHCLYHVQHEGMTYQLRIPSAENMIGVTGPNLDAALLQHGADVRTACILQLDTYGYNHAVTMVKWQGDWWLPRPYA